jgi:NAD-dependent deacetylase
VSVQQLADLFRARGPVVVLTGAGISTESGIPDFRSPTGIWAHYDPAEYATIEAFRADPVKVLSFYSLRLRVLVEAEPNDGHRAIAELERAGHVAAIVTQNIDGLHREAGSRDITGCTARSGLRCLACGAYSLAELLELLEVQRLQPVRNAGDRETGRRDVRRAHARSGDRPGLRAGAGHGADARGGVGAGESGRCPQLPDETRSHGGDVAIVNKGRTSFDGLAAVKCDGAAGESLTALVGELTKAPTRRRALGTITVRQSRQTRCSTS